MLIDPHYPELPEWLHELYPFRTRTLQLGSYRMSLVDEGPVDAPALVLLHGNPTWSFLYRDLIGRTREQYRVIAPDNIGFGLSDKPSASGYHTLDRHILNLAQVVEALNLRNLTLVMNGWGGPIGMGYAVSHPQNIARLVLAGTWAANLPRKTPLKLPLGMRIAAKGRVGDWLDSLLNLSLHSVFASRTYRSMSDMAMEAYSYPFRSKASREAVVAFSRMYYEPDRETTSRLIEIQAGLKKIEAPASIVMGERDALLGKMPAYLLRDELKHAAEPVFVPNAAHYLPEEAPDALADVVLHEPKVAEESSSETVFKIIG